MAYVGLRYAVFAPLTAENENAAPTYGAGVVCGHAVHAAVSYERSDEKMYGDDIVVESENRITGGTVTLELDDIEFDARKVILGLHEADGVYRENSANAPCGGLGYIRIRSKGEKPYIAYWVVKTQFGVTSEESDTRKEKTEFKSTTIEGQMMGLYIDETGEATFREYEAFATEAAAKAWINSKANIA